MYFIQTGKATLFLLFLRTGKKKIARIRIRAICNINLNLLSCSDRYLNQSIKSKLLDSHLSNITGYEKCVIKPYKVSCSSRKATLSFFFLKPAKKKIARIHIRTIPTLTQIKITIGFSSSNKIKRASPGFTS